MTPGHPIQIAYEILIENVSNTTYSYNFAFGITSKNITPLYNNYHYM